MAALSTIIDDATDVGVSVRADLIPAFVAAYERPLPVGMRLCQMRAGEGNVPARFGYWGALSQAPASKTESDEFALTDATQSESSVTPSIVGVRAFISDEALTSVGNDSVPAGFLGELMSALMDQMDTTILAVSTSATNTAGTVSRDYTLDEFRSDLRAFKALHAGVNGPVCVTLHNQGMADLLGSLHATSATMPTSGGDSAALDTMQGFQGVLHGVELWETDNVPTESTGHSGLMTAKGGMSSYACVVIQAPTIIRTRYDDAEARAGTYFVARQQYGAGLVYPNKCLEVLHQ